MIITEREMVEALNKYVDRNLFVTTYASRVGSRFIVAVTSTADKAIAKAKASGGLEAEVWGCTDIQVGFERHEFKEKFHV